MIITFLLALSLRAAAVEDCGYRPVFHHQECQACLLDHAEGSRRMVVPTYHGASDFVFRVERAMVPADTHEDFTRDDPRFIWFTSSPVEDPASVKNRANEAAFESATAEAEVHAVKPTFLARPLGSNLTEFELRALGLDPAIQATPKDISGRITVGAEGWILDVRVRGKPAGNVTLPSADFELGYSNKVYEWQWERIENALRRGRTDGPSTPAGYLLEHAHTAFTRQVGDRKLGYFLRTYPRHGEGAWARLEIALLRPASRKASSTAHIIFPRSTDHTEPFASPRIHQTVSDLGLRVVFAVD